MRSLARNMLKDVAMSWASSTPPVEGGAPPGAHTIQSIAIRKTRPTTSRKTQSDRLLDLFSIIERGRWSRSPGKNSQLTKALHPSLETVDVILVTHRVHVGKTPRLRTCGDCLTPISTSALGPLPSWHGSILPVC